MVARGFVRCGAGARLRAATIREYGVKAGGAEAAARSLSGGNLQKFIVGREIRQRPKVLIAAQPTWGVDVGAAAQIRQALLDLRDAGVAVLVVSEELDELFEICDRLAVIAQGRLSRCEAGARHQCRGDRPADVRRRSSPAARKRSAHSRRPAHAGGTMPLCIRSKRARAVARRPARLAAGRRRGRRWSIGFVLFSALGKDPWQALYVFFIEPVDTLYDVGELLLKASAAHAVRDRPRRRLPRQRLEHRRRGPAHHGRDLRRRRRARVPRLGVAARCCR